MSRLSRRVPAQIAVLAVAVCSLSVLGVNTTTQAAEAARKGQVTLVLKAPRGIPVQALLTAGGGVVSKPAAARKQVARLRLRSGSYRIKPATSTIEGVVYSPSLRVKKIRVKAGSKTKVVIRWRKVARPVKAQVVSTTATSVSLQWAASSGQKKYVVRRSEGDKAPRTRAAGSKVSEGKATKVTDSNLTPGRTYSYSVFSRSRRGWVGPATLTTATVGTDPVTGTPTASYALAPHAELVEAGDRDEVTVSNGQLWVRYAPSRPAPVLGAGVSLPISAILPGGFLGTVAEIASDGRTVRVVQGGFPDVFSHYDLSTSFTKTVDYGPMVTAPAAARTPLARSHQASKGSADKGTMTASRADAQESCLNYTAAQVTGSVDPTLTASGSYSTKVHSTWGIPHAVEVGSSVKMSAGATMDLKVSTALACKIGGDNFVLTIASAPVPVSLLWEFGVSVGAAGGIDVKKLGYIATADFSANARMGTSASFVSSSNIDGDLVSPTGSGSAEAALSVGGAVTVGPGTGTKDLGAIAGIGGTLDIMKLSASGAFGADEANSCVTLKAESAAAIRLYASAWAGPLSAEASFPLWEGSKPWATRTIPAGCDAVDPELGSGDVQATLEWSNSDDMDLHVTDPAGSEIYFGEPTAPSGGALDYDEIPECVDGATGMNNVENVFWPTGESPTGAYQVQVVEYNDCTAAEATWTLTVRVAGRLVLRRTGQGTSPIYQFSNGV